MSAPVAAEVLRELGAEVRQFRSVCAALCWYRDQLAARLRVSRHPNSDSVRLSRVAIDQGRATFARLTNCLQPEHDADSTLSSIPLRRMLPLDRELLVWLVAWYEGDWGDGSDLARRAGLTRWSFDRRCRRTENLLRPRLEHAQLLLPSET